jgi:predicted ATPase
MWLTDAVGTMSTTTLNQTGLVGREDEFDALLQAYQNTWQVDEGQPQELVLIRGQSGTGKTSLGNALMDVVHHDDGFFLTCKFELTALQKPYAAFIALFDKFTQDLYRESKEVDEATMAKTRRVVQDAVGDEGKLLTDMIPSLERLIGKQESLCEVRASEAINRFQFVFCKFCRSISTVAPLVLIFDDLQWSDTASLDLILALLQSGGVNGNRSSLLVIGTYRDEGIVNEPHLVPAGCLPASPVTRYLKKFNELSEAGELSKTDISLKNLNEGSMIGLVANVLKATKLDTTADLAKLIHSTCDGNPYDAVQLLRLLVNQEHLYRDNHCEDLWLWDEKNILEVINSADTVDEMFRQKFLSLPDLVQQMLQLAACIGDTIDFLALSTALDEATVSDIELSLQVASREGFLLFDRQHSLFRFVHDRMRQVVLSSVDDQDELSFQIGYKLWTRSPPHFLSAKLFVVTNLLNCGIPKLTEQSLRYDAAALNLEAGLQCTSLAAFPDASKYLRAGIRLLEGGDYWIEQYDLALHMFSAAADAEVGNQDFGRVSDLAGMVLEHAHCMKDSLVAYRANINSLGQQGLVREAAIVGFEALHRLGERMPQNATRSANILENIETKFSLRWCSSKDLLGRSVSENEDKIAAIQILNSLWPYIYRSGCKDAQLLVTRLVRLCLHHMHKESAYGFGMYGSVLCVKDIAQGYRLGSLALSIVKKYRAREMIPSIHFVFYSFIHHWKRPLKESIKFLHQVDKVAMQLGDMEYAMMALVVKCFHELCCGMALRSVS